MKSTPVRYCLTEGDLEFDLAQTGAQWVLLYQGESLRTFPNVKSAEGWAQTYATALMKAKAAQAELDALKKAP